MDGGATGGYCAIGSCVIDHAAHHHDEQRDHPGEDGALDEESAMSAPQRLAPRRAWRPSAGALARVRHGTGLTLGRAGSLEAVDHHLLAGLEPFEDDPVAAPAGAGLDRAAQKLPSRPTTITLSPCSERVTACCGSMIALSALACSSRTRTNRPGSSSPPWGWAPRRAA